MKIFETSLNRGKFDSSRKLNNGELMKFEKIYAMDAVYDNPEDVPEDVSSCCALLLPSGPLLEWQVFNDMDCFFF